MAARKTAAELAAEVKIAEVRQATPLESYYVTAEHILRQARARAAPTPAHVLALSPAVGCCARCVRVLQAWAPCHRQR